MLAVTVACFETINTKENGYVASCSRFRGTIGAAERSISHKRCGLARLLRISTTLGHSRCRALSTQVPTSIPVVFLSARGEAVATRGPHTVDIFDGASQMAATNYKCKESLGPKRKSTADAYALRSGGNTRHDHASLTAACPRTEHVYFETGIPPLQKLIKSRKSSQTACVKVHMVLVRRVQHTRMRGYATFAACGCNSG